MAKSKSKSAKGGSKLAQIKVSTSISTEQGQAQLDVLKARFEQHMSRHEGLEWDKVQAKLASHSDKLASLHAMEATGGEPDVVGYDEASDEYIFYDCSAESPDGRRSICYDRAGEDERVKKNIHPAGNALDLASDLGIEILTEEQYRHLQTLGEFDLKTSSWLKTPAEIRDLGGAIFGDRRFNHVFVYHNGAQSFYGARGFRGALKV